MKNTESKTGIESFKIESTVYKVLSDVREIKGGKKKIKKGFIKAESIKSIGTFEIKELKKRRFVKIIFCINNFSNFKKF